MNTFENALQYAEAKDKVNAYNSTANAWRKENKKNGIPVEICATFPFADTVTNELRSKIEVWEFVHDIPEKYFLYIDEENWTATTWVGGTLGTVTFGSAFKSNFGDTRQHITVLAINGKAYYGTYYKSSGNYARIKIAKTKTSKSI